MLNDLRDILAAGYWKVIAMLVMLGLGLGLYIWARHEHRSMAQQEAAKRAAKARAHRQKSDRLRHHLTVGKRRRIAFSFRTQKRRFLFIKTRPTLHGWVENTPQGLRFAIAQGRKVMLFTDALGDGLRGNDLVGLVRRDALTRASTQPKGTRSPKAKGKRDITRLLQPIEHTGPFKKRRYKKLYKLAFLAAMRALRADRQHLKLVQRLRRSHPARITLTKRQRKRAPSATKGAWWAFWRRGPRRIQLQPSPKGLALIYHERKRPYGCKRKLLTLWKKKCQGTERIQRLFYDSGAPGLNPNDGDRHGIRILRDGSLYQSKRLTAFETHPAKRQQGLRETYQMLIELTADALQAKRPRKPRQTSPTRGRQTPRPRPTPRQATPAAPASKAPQKRPLRRPAAARSGVDARPTPAPSPRRDPASQRRPKSGQSTKPASPHR